MLTFEFNPISNSVTLQFMCPHCGVVNETDALYVPTPNWNAETHSDSIEYEEYEHCCECGETFNITLYNGFYGGSGEISPDVEGLYVTEDYGEDYDEEIEDLMYSQLYDSHVVDTMKALDAIEALDENVKITLHRVLYANIIACMESYLSDKFIYEVLSKDENKRIFVKGFKDYADQKIPLNELFERFDNIEAFIRKTLRDIIYHKLPKVKGMYKDILCIDIGDISNLCKCVSIRHDIVHRNGKNKEGNEVAINKTDVEDVAKLVSNMIKNIESQFREMNECSEKTKIDYH